MIGDVFKISSETEFVIGCCQTLAIVKIDSFINFNDKHLADFHNFCCSDKCTIQRLVHFLFLI